MKFKCKPEKSNSILMSMLLLLCLTTCFMWLAIREYIYFFIYISLTLIIAHIYYFTTYIIYNKKLIIKLGIIKLKINYKKIKKVELVKERVKLQLDKFSINLYPANKEMFIAKINSKLVSEKENE